MLVTSAPDGSELPAVGEPESSPDEEQSEECLANAETHPGEHEHCVNSTSPSEYTIPNCIEQIDNVILDRWPHRCW